MIPVTYHEWRQCITQRCGVELSASFITGRLRVMSDPEAPASRLFARCYGMEHYRRVITWLAAGPAGAAPLKPIFPYSKI